MFYGILIFMRYMDTDKHHLPHIHVKYSQYYASININDGAVLSGELPPKQLLLVQAWIVLHKEELSANWELAVQGENIYKIEPLK